MKKVQVLFLSFGERRDIYRQVYFALRTVQRHHCNEISFNIVTDSPDMFGAITNEVTLHSLSHQDIVEWRGRHDFLFRVKMKAIEFIAQTYPDSPVLFLDSDTAMQSHPAKIINLIKAEKTVMHMKENVLSQSSDKADKLLMSALSGFSYRNYAFTKSTRMFNSGVVGLPAKQAKQLMEESIAVCDAMCETNVNRAFIEQLAIGMVLNQSSDLHTAEEYVIHYWGNKPEWNMFIDNFIIDSKLKSLTTEEELVQLNKLDLAKIPIISRPQINNKRLKSLADKLFPKKRQIFFNLSEK